MKQMRMLKYIISLLCVFCLNVSFAQSKTDSIPPASTNDSLVIKKKYGIRIGADISKPIITARDANYQGFELVADYRLKKNLYLAGEMGYVEKKSLEDNYNFTTEGSYMNIGININSFKNWLEMDNEIFYGFRYGFSSFSQTLNEYTVFQEGSQIGNLSSAYFTANSVQPNEKFSNLNAHWVAMVVGIKVETFKNLYFGFMANMSRLIATKEPNNFKNLYIPGFTKVFTSNGGVSFNYTISYRIPLYKK